MAHVEKPRVRETSLTIGTGAYVLAGRMFGSSSFANEMAVGDTCDYVASYGDMFEEATGTLNASGHLERTTITRARHADGTLNTSAVSWPAGVKTIILGMRADRLAAIRGAVRFDVAQSLSAAQKRQALDSLGLFPTGTKMLFQQTAAPTGWTKDTTHNDKALRVVSGTAGFGGSVLFSTVFGRTATDGFTLSSGTIGPHTHTGGVNDKFERASAQDFVGVPAGGDYPVPTSVSNSALTALTAHTTDSAGGGLAHSHGMDMRVAYVDVIVATKD